MALVLSSSTPSSSGGGGGGANPTTPAAKTATALTTTTTTIEAYNAYPAAMAKYEEVVANQKLFMETLEKLHLTMRTKFMIPIIGGKDLDLHRLFVEVTSRGGIEKIVKEKKWKEVTAAFNFPSTATNASFVLRKYYYQLLTHYEQIYFFKSRNWTPPPPPLILSSATAVHHSPPAVSPFILPSSSPSAVHRSPAAVIPPQPQPQPIPTPTNQAGIKLTPTTAPPGTGTPVVGVIDGKFESGYLVTVTIGAQKLKGVLYQTTATKQKAAASTYTAQYSSSVPTPAPAAPNNNKRRHAADVDDGAVAQQQEQEQQPALKKRRRRRKKSEIRKRDPDHPKPNRSGYNFFFAEQHARLKPHYSGRDREISRMIGELWTNLKENDRVVYQEKAMEDKERYRREMVGYRERRHQQQQRQQQQQVLGMEMGEVKDAVPIQQRRMPTMNMVPDLDEKMVDVVVEDGTISALAAAKGMRYSLAAAALFDDDEEEDVDEEDEMSTSVSGNSGADHADKGSGSGENLLVEKKPSCPIESESAANNSSGGRGGGGEDNNKGGGGDVAAESEKVG